jgi:hypothetical protein
MRLAARPGDDGTTPRAKAIAYLRLAGYAAPTDRRKAKLLADKAVSEDPSLVEARALRDDLKLG